MFERFLKKENKHFDYNIKVRDDDYSLVFKSKVPKSYLLNQFNKLRRKFPVKESFKDIEQDGWVIDPADGKLFESMLGAVSKHLRKHVKNVELDARKEHPAFRILSHELENICFKKIKGEKFEILININGICV